MRVGAILESIDRMAERIRRIAGTTIRSISHIDQIQTIEDDNSIRVPAEYMVQILMEDNGHIAKMMREAFTAIAIFHKDKQCKYHFQVES